MLKKCPFSKAPHEGPEAYPLEYDVGLNKARTLLAYCFNVLAGSHRIDWLAVKHRTTTVLF